MLIFRSKSCKTQFLELFLEKYTAKSAITSLQARLSMVQSVEIIESLSAVLLVEPCKTKLQNVIQKIRIMQK